MEAASKKVKLKTFQGKLVQFQEQNDLAFTLLVKSQLQENPPACKNFLHIPEHLCSTALVLQMHYFTPLLA